MLALPTAEQEASNNCQENQSQRDGDCYYRGLSTLTGGGYCQRKDRK